MIIHPARPEVRHDLVDHRGTAGKTGAIHECRNAVAEGANQKAHSPRLAVGEGSGPANRCPGRQDGHDAGDTGMVG